MVRRPHSTPRPARWCKFGGFGSSKRASGLYDQTWTWDGSNWNLRAGTAGPAVKIPVPSPVSLPPAIGLPGSAGGASTGAPVTTTGAAGLIAP